MNSQRALKGTAMAILFGWILLAVWAIAGIAFFPASAVALAGGLGFAMGWWQRGDT